MPNRGRARRAATDPVSGCQILKSTSGSILASRTVQPSFKPEPALPLKSIIPYIRLCRLAVLLNSRIAGARFLSHRCCIRSTISMTRFNNSPEGASIVLKWSTCCRCSLLALLSFIVAATAGAAAPGNGLDEVLNRENAKLAVGLKPAPIANDLVYLRRVTVDLIGRIPTEAEIQEYSALPSKTRRAQVVERLLADKRFSDRWTTFFADMLRLRSNAEGGATLIAFVHRALEEGMPYDELSRRLISAGGKSGRFLKSDSFSVTMPTRWRWPGSPRRSFSVCGWPVRSVTTIRSTNGHAKISTD